MKLNIIHCIAVCLAAFALPCIVGCSNRDESLLDDYASDATLFLDIATIETSKPDAETLPDNEKMHSVRVVILHPDGTVEHNKYYSLDGAQAQESVLLKVTPNEKKKIFIFANEESITSVEGVALNGGDKSLSAFFDFYAEGSSGFETAVNNLYFAPDYSEGENIPMSSMYEVDIPEKTVIRKTFYVVRVATKFIVNFINWRGEEVVVDDFTITGSADRNFLLAHVEDTPQNRVLFEGKTWINWLKDVSDASSVNDGYDITEAAGWLKDYVLPDQAVTGTYSLSSPVSVASANLDMDNKDTEPGRVSVSFYLPESQNYKSGSGDGEQEYVLTIKIAGMPTPFVRSLPNLKALFRNTSVVVNITMFQNMEMSVDVIPFTSIVVDYDFGLEREEYTGYIVGKDEDGNKCWYDGAEGPYYLGPVGNHGSFVTVNGKEYLLVYTDFERTSANLNHIYEKESRRKYILTPEGITGYKFGNDMYLNNLKKRVWIDSGGDPNGDDSERSIYEALKKVGLNLKCCRILYEWDRLDWNRARWWGWSGVYPKFWFDIFGNRYSWEEGDTEAKRKDILGEWVKYLE